MSPFLFQSVQSLTLSKEDKPQIDIHGGNLVLTAERAGERIVITAPLAGSVPQVAQTVVNAPKRNARKRRNYLHISGQNHKLAKLTEDQVKEIRHMADDPALMATYGSRSAFYQELAKIYNVHQTTIGHIVTRETWKHI